MVKYSGLIFALLDEVAKKLNFTYVVKEPGSMVIIKAFVVRLQKNTRFLVATLSPSPLLGVNAEKKSSKTEQIISFNEIDDIYFV